MATKTTDGFGATIKKKLLSLFSFAGRTGNKLIKAEEKTPILLKVGFLVLLAVGSAFATYVFLQDKNLAIFQPSGIVAQKQYTLIKFAAFLSLFVVVPVYAMTFYIARKYRATNPKAKYRPDFVSSRLAETVWWGIPIILISVLSVVTWVSTHQLDPYKPIVSHKKPLKIQVVALEWKWLFIYPEQNIATVNYVQVPVDQPVEFSVTSDAPMNSLWIPQLGSQVYAMSGMSTKLNMMATALGDYAGSSANISGDGFAGMKFNVRVSSDGEFRDWVTGVRATATALDKQSYATLAVRSENVPPMLFVLADQDLYDSIIMKYMMHMPENYKELR